MNDKISEIFFLGSWLPSEVIVNEIESTRLKNSDIEALTKKKWLTTLAEAKKGEKKIWDSLIYRFEGSRIINKKLELNLSTIDYSTRVEMNNLTDKIKILGRQYAPQGMFSSSLVRTKDGKYVFVEKSGKYWTNKKISWIGGVFSKDELVINNAESLFKAAKNEVKEETGIPYEYLEKSTLNAGFLTYNWNVCFLFQIKLELTVAEVKRYFNSNSDDEASRVIFVNERLSDIWGEMSSRDKVKFELLRDYNML